MKCLGLILLVPLFLGAQSLEEGKQLVRAGHVAEAKKIFETVLRGDEKNAEAHFQLGLILLRRNFRDEDSAVDHMEEAVELVPTNADYQYGYGAALGMKAQNASIFKQAFLAPKIKNAFLKTIELNPSHIQARLGLAQYYLLAPGIMGGDDDKGWQQIDEVIRLDEYQGRLAKSRLLQNKKKPAEAEGELKTLSTDLPNDWRVWKALGYFYVQQKQNSQAITAMQTYVVLRPDTADSHKCLAEAQLQKGDYDDALGSLRKALSLDKDFITAVYLMGKTYEAKGLKNEARQYYQRVLELNPGEYLRKQTEKNLKDLSS